MTPAVRFRPEAAAELADAQQWYDARRAGLGIALVDAVDAAVEVLVRWPASGAPVRRVAADLGARRLQIQRFPYSLIYVADAEAIVVLAVAHDRRRPLYWGGRAGS